MKVVDSSRSDRRITKAGRFCPKGKRALRGRLKRGIGVKQLGSADRYRVGMCAWKNEEDSHDTQGYRYTAETHVEEDSSASNSMSIPEGAPFGGSVFRRNRGSC